MKAGFLLKDPIEADTKTTLEQADSRQKFTWKRGGQARQQELEEKLENDFDVGSHRLSTNSTQIGGSGSAPLWSDAPMPAEPAAPAPVEEVVNVYCPRRHVLRFEAAPYDMECDRCGSEMAGGQKIWWCGLCGYDLCEDCHAEKSLE
mmetsp:Transcript_42910/g.76923  ORF Transcript_42910/g.76923 Transcript_42910/m.76923 type:complete len:147 (+) Transcript_42910:49-489(+)